MNPLNTVENTSETPPQTGQIADSSAARERYRMEFTQFYDVWKVYMQWYTVFLTFNVAALVFYNSLFDMSKQQSIGVIVWPRVAIGVFFLVQDSMATITSIMIARFSVIRSKYLEDLSAASTSKGASEFILLTRHPLIPCGLTVMGAVFNAIGALSLAVIWMLVTPWT